MEQLLQDTVRHLFGVELPIQLTRPDAQFGDYATNVALQLAKPLGRSPREIADELSLALRESDVFSDVSVAGPGFINLRIAAHNLAATLENQWSESYGETEEGKGIQLSALLAWMYQQ